MNIMSDKCNYVVKVSCDDYLGGMSGYYLKRGNGIWNNFIITEKDMERLRKDSFDTIREAKGAIEKIKINYCKSYQEIIEYAKEHGPEDVQLSKQDKLKSLVDSEFDFSVISIDDMLDEFRKNGLIRM